MNDRLNHMLRTANQMRCIASKYNNDEDYLNEMYILGFLHDIGRFVDNNNHEETGADILSGYKYSEEIRYHGHLQSVYSSKELDYLYLADMTSGPNGELLTIEERLEDIKERYGEDSKTYKDSLEVAQYLKDKKYI